MNNYKSILNMEIKDIDPQLSELDKLEGLRQLQKINMIAATSICPSSVRKMLASNFNNIDAEGYPPKWIHSDFSLNNIDFKIEQERHLKLDDSRPNRNTMWANIVEVIAQKRLAKLLSTKSTAPEEIYVNVQPFSGSLANQAALESILQPGDRVLAMSLDSGGHLSHGSSFHNSSRRYKFKHYGINSNTGKIDYLQISQIVETFQPKLIIGGASAYPWDIEWAKLRKIANRQNNNTYVMADIAHTAGLVVGKAISNPIDYADIVTLVTYKTFCGPRGAAIITKNEQLSNQVNKAVFPFIQSSPAIQNIAAMAVSFKIAMLPEFKILQKKIILNAQYISQKLSTKGLTIAYGGTSTHMFLIDLKNILAKTEFSAHSIAKCLDSNGIVCNKNPLPGDIKLSQSTGLRFGTTWITQLNYAKDDLDKIVDTIANTINSFNVKA